MSGEVSKNEMKNGHMQQSGMLVLGNRCLPLAGSLGSPGLDGSVVTASALS